MKFIDLFAGLGGFHVALHSLGHTCVFASELDESLRQLYAKNFGLMPEGDIRKIRIKEIPSHDILCAGFPCQPFSKAGGQQGLSCPKWGDLFDYVIKILRYHQPKYFILENVPNLLRHDEGETWEKMERRLKNAGYSIDDHRLSPHHFGIPQVRERIFIVGSLSGLNGFSWPEVKRESSTSILNMLEKSPINARQLSPKVTECLNVWQEFIRCFPKDEELPSFPIWSMEFGATYPYEDTTPFAIGNAALRSYRGNHGKRFKSVALVWRAILRTGADRNPSLGLHRYTPPSLTDLWQQWNKPYANGGALHNNFKQDGAQMLMLGCQVYTINRCPPSKNFDQLWMRLL